MKGKERNELGELELGDEVRVSPPGVDYCQGHTTRVARIDKSGQEWVKIGGRYYKYPEKFKGKLNWRSLIRKVTGK